MARTPEATLKAITAKREKAESYAQQRVVIDENWVIQRDDELNWKILYKGKFHGFYGTIGAALKVLPAKMLSETAKGSLSDVLRSVEAIRETIERAIP